MHPLLAALAMWPGRQATKAVLEAKGYWLPERYREIVFANCGGCDGAKVERYWDEVAREYLYSGGRVKPDRRRFGGETAYRSEYLDDLASATASSGGELDGLPLDSGARAFYNKMRTVISGTLFGQRVYEHMLEYKKTEIENFGPSADGWTCTKGDFANFLGKIVEARGFICKKKKWRKSFGDTLEFCISIDGGMRRTWKFQLPLIVEILHKEAPDLSLFTLNANTPMPGFHYYHLHRSPESAILGIQAHADLLDSIGLLIARRGLSAS